jgi:hypothetical protein
MTINLPRILPDQMRLHWQRKRKQNQRPDDRKRNQRQQKMRQ